MTRVICDCGRSYTPSQKYRDPRVRCNICLRSISRAEVKVKAVEYLGGKCKDCLHYFHPVIYDFDHRDEQDKEFNISSNYRFRWVELKRELDKCDLRCANCHRLRHYLQHPP